jgi:hypothetical protein
LGFAVEGKTQVEESVHDRQEAGFVLGALDLLPEGGDDFDRFAVGMEESIGTLSTRARTTGRHANVLLVGFFALGSLPGGHSLVLELGTIVLQLLVEDDALLLQILVIGVERFQLLVL